MVARLLMCVQFSGSARQYYKFRVTSDQNYCGSEPLLNNGTGVIFGMIHFSVGLLLLVGQPSSLTVKIKRTCIQGVSQFEVYPGMQDLIEIFFEVGSNFTEDGSFCYFYLTFHRNACENDFSLMGVK